MPKITVHGGPTNVAAPRDDVVPDESPAVVDEDVPDVDVPEGDGYDDSLVQDLSAELRSRNLPYTGTKGELIARLREDDAARQPNDAGE